MLVGIVGRNWGANYARVLKQLKIPYWQDGRGWHMRHADRLIIACPNAAHYEVARCAIGRGMPVLIEKPMTLDANDAWALCDGVGMVAHTRLYSPAWRAFRQPARKVIAHAGGVTASNPDALWNWIPHLVAMCLDCGVWEAEFHVADERLPLRFIADGREFVDVPDDPLAVMVGEFLECTDNAGLRFGARVVAITEKLIQRGSFGNFHLYRAPAGGNAMEC